MNSFISNKSLPILISILLFKCTLAFSQSNSVSTENKNDLVKIEVKQNYGEKVAQVSFNGKQTNNELNVEYTIYDANNVAVKKSSIELISSPNYAGISVNDFKTGNYSLVIIINGEPFKSDFTIK